ncbi:MAG: DUF2794 domain-containing protein [Candidatus Fonsibacter ubiquis]|nr:DUF2794 domain-containing protein [Candidatus Fonsibacter ubiquis]
MNKGLIKFFLDLGPLLIFFYFYKKHGMIYAIMPLIIATIISVFFVYRIDKKIPTIPVLGAIIVTAFGGLTLLFDNKIFFYMKPTIVNLIFAVILLYGEIILKKPLLKNLFEGSIKMTDEGWNILNRRQEILNLYGSMVSAGEWKDYGIFMGKNIISFEIYRKATENPLFQILKILNQKDKNKYQLKDSSGLVIKISDNLNSILKIISKKCSKRYLKIIK